MSDEITNAAAPGQRLEETVMRRAILLWISLIIPSVSFADEPLPRILAPHFKPPAEFADQFGDYKSPLRFNDGNEVKTAKDWQRRRQETLKTWHDLMGPWPERIAKPKVEIIEKEHIDNYTR